MNTSNPSNLDLGPSDGCNQVQEIGLAIAPPSAANMEHVCRVLRSVELLVGPVGQQPGSCIGRYLQKSGPLMVSRFVASRLILVAK